MGVLIVLGTALVIGVIIHRLYAKSPVASNFAGQSPPALIGAAPLPGGGAPGVPAAGVAAPGAALAPAAGGAVVGNAGAAARLAAAQGKGGGLQPGEQILGIAGAAGKVAVWVRGPAGDRLLLVDPANGGVSLVLGQH